MKMKTIQNEHYKKLCDIICSYCNTADKAKKCFSTMKDASYDKENKEWVYEFLPDAGNVLKLDDFSEIFAEIHQKKGFLSHQPKAVDAVCIDENNNWYLIEFKNRKLDNAIKSIKEKMLSSLWLLLHTYSDTGNAIEDATAFAQKHVTYIVVCSKDKNSADALRVHQAESTGEHYTPHKLLEFKGYYFKDIYMYTETELRQFIADFK